MATHSTLAQHTEVADGVIAQQIAGMISAANWLLVPLVILFVAMVILYLVGRLGRYRVVDPNAPPDVPPPQLVAGAPAPDPTTGVAPQWANPMHQYTGTRYILTEKGYVTRLAYVTLLYWCQVALFLWVGLRTLAFFEVAVPNAGTWTILLWLVGGFVNGLMAYGDANPDVADEYEEKEKGPDGKECTKTKREFHNARRGLARPHPNGEVLAKHLGDYSYSYLKAIHPTLGVGGILPYFWPLEGLEHHMALGDAHSKRAVVQDGKIVQVEEVLPQSHSEEQPWETAIGADTPLEMPPIVVMNKSRDEVILDIDPQYSIFHALRARFRTDIAKLRQLLVNRASSAASEVVMDLTTDEMVEGEGEERKAREDVKAQLVRDINDKLLELAWYGAEMTINIKDYRIPAAITQRAQERSARAKSRGMEKLVDLGVDPTAALGYLTGEEVAKSGKIGTVVAVTGLHDIVGAGAARFLGGDHVPREPRVRGPRTGGDAGGTGEGPSRETIVAEAPPDGPGDAAGTEANLGAEPAAPATGESGDELALLDPDLLGSLDAEAPDSADQPVEAEE